MNLKFNINKNIKRTQFNNKLNFYQIKSNNI